MDKQSWNYYEVLDVSPKVDQDVIYRAYKRAKKIFSPSNPDLFNIFTKEEILQWVNIIEEAYSVIGHPNSRRVYDMRLNSLFSKHTRALNFIDGKPEENGLKQKKPAKGLAHTRISRYKINQEMEKIISNSESFDGPFLKKIREYKNIKLPDFSELTRITIAYLKAIEKNDHSNLPAPVFVRGYIIQYCHILGLDESKVVSSYMSLLKLKNG